MLTLFHAMKRLCRCTFIDQEALDLVIYLRQALYERSQR